MPDRGTRACEKAGPGQELKKIVANLRASVPLGASELHFARRSFIEIVTIASTTTARC